MNWISRLRKRRQDEDKSVNAPAAKPSSLAVAEQTHRRVLDLAHDINDSNAELKKRADKMVDSIEGVARLMEKEGGRLHLGRR